MTVALRRQLLGSPGSYGQSLVHRSLSSPEPPGEVGTVLLSSYREGPGQTEVEDLLEGTQEDLAEPGSKPREAGSRTAGGEGGRRWAISKAVCRTNTAAKVAGELGSRGELRKGTLGSSHAGQGTRWATGLNPVYRASTGPAACPAREREGAGRRRSARAIATLAGSEAPRPLPG